MFFWRKRKEVTAKPVCIHDWYLIDTNVRESYNGYDIDLDKVYTVGCPHCNERKSMDEYQYRHFSKVFDIHTKCIDRKGDTR